ncbi:hypothetical protein Pan97_07100 [Bremerella volcania]|uniref:DUF427 domain-containing protein n=1 Tax=Bremerella volcania TaxID=2527984 RepID=A0A518C3A7_9BACT|nr:DUF427 domain-containing protein [Bremerella volcania]QDU73712.1 hypothetical protein Pan97_07100 [Bremerella volcania]
MDHSERVKLARSCWKNTGQNRPAFAIEPKEGEESVWDYPRPPVIVEDNREVIVRSGQVIIAHTTRSLRICETASPPTFYLPPSDVDQKYLSRTASRTFCEWKGQATYWSLAIPEQLEKANIGWSYERPSVEFEPIQGFFSFYPGRIDCFVDGHAVLPQAGNFYGGWITPEIVGPFKGEPGTFGW